MYKKIFNKTFVNPPVYLKIVNQDLKFLRKFCFDFFEFRGMASHQLQLAFR